VEKGFISTAIGYELVDPKIWGKPVRAEHGLDGICIYFLKNKNMYIGKTRIVHSVLKGNLVNIPEPISGFKMYIFKNNIYFN